MNIDFILHKAPVFLIAILSGKFSWCYCLTVGSYKYTISSFSLADHVLVDYNLIKAASCLNFVSRESCKQALHISLIQYCSTAGDWRLYYCLCSSFSTPGAGRQREQKAQLELALHSSVSLGCRSRWSSSPPSQHITPTRHKTEQPQGRFTSDLLRTEQAQEARSDNCPAHTV